MAGGAGEGAWERGVAGALASLALRQTVHSERCVLMRACGAMLLMRRLQGKTTHVHVVHNAGGSHTSMNRMNPLFRFAGWISCILRDHH